MKALISIIFLALLVAPSVRPARQAVQQPLREAPPKEKGPFREADLVELINIDPTFKLDIRYATPNNFVGRATETTLVNMRRIRI